MKPTICQFVTRCLFAACAVAPGLLLSGCEEPSLAYTEVKRIDEVIYPSELEVFFKVTSMLPQKRLPEMESVFSPPRKWNPARKLPVSELTNEEIARVDAFWNVEEIANKQRDNRILQNALKRGRMTLEQYVGLAQAIGVALGRSQLRENQDLEKILQRGETQIAELSANRSNFSTLSQADRYAAVQQSIWVTRVARARRLQQVPPENIELVQKHFDALAMIFPPEYSSNPLDSIADLLDERGMPFEELPDSGSDSQITWDESTVIRGDDPLDQEFVKEGAEEIERLVREW